MYRDILKVYDQDCIIYDTSLDNTAYDAGSGDYSSSIERVMTYEFNWQVWCAMLVGWAAIFLACHRSVDTIKYVIYVTFPLSLVFMLVLILFGVTLGCGASDGVNEYLWGKSDREYRLWDELQTSLIWTDAATQAIYSCGLGMWSTYGSYKSVTAPVVGDGIAIVVMDTAYAFLAGIAMFSVVGYLRHEGFPLEGEKGLEMAFIALPTAIAMRTESPRFWSACLFFSFVSFGYDS